MPDRLRLVVQPFLVRFEYLLHDLSKISDEVQQGIQGVLVRLLRQRFGDAVNPDVEQRIAAASLEQVEAWTGRVLSAAMLAAVLTD